jgi:hypothetical protein
MAKVGRTPELSRVRRRWVKEDEVKEPSCTVVVEMWRTFERQQTSRAFADKGIAAKATGLVENSKPLREKVKREQYGKECAKEMRWLLEVEGGWKLRELM